MADKREFTFHLKTTGDPSGAKEVEKAIDNVVEATESIGSSASGGAISLERGLRETATAASATDKTVDALENSIQHLNEEISKNKSLTDDQVKNFKRLTDGGERLLKLNREQRSTADTASKSTRNYGLAALEASRALEDLQYGIGGVLNNLPGLVMMLGGGAGLTAVISIAAVAGAQLWKRLVTGPEEAEKATEDWVETLEKAQKVFQAMETSAITAQGDRIAERARSLASVLAGIDYDSRRGAAGESTDARKIEAERLVALARNRLDIVKNETALLAASGEEAVKLAERRKQLAKEVSAIELAALERRRELEAERANRELATAQRRSEAIKESEASAEKELNEIVAQQKEMFEAADSLTRSRVELVGAMRDEIAALRQEQEDIDKRDKYHLSPTAAADAIDQLEARIEAKLRIIDSSSQPSQGEANANLEAQAMQPRLDKAAEELRKLSEEQRKASDAIRDAALAVKGIRDTQSIERDGEKQIRDIEKQIEVIKGPDQTKTVESLGNLTDQLEGVPELAGLTAQIKALISDKTLTAEEQVKTQVLLNQYFAKVANLGSQQNTAIREALTRIDDLERETRQLRGNQSNSVPSN